MKADTSINGQSIDGHPHDSRADTPGADPHAVPVAPTTRTTDTRLGSYQLVTTGNEVVARISARGSAVLSSPTINRGTAFTLAERDALGHRGAGDRGHAA